MTDYDTNMTATEQIPMPELYEIRTGWSRVYYTSYNQILLHNNHNYLPVTIQRGEFTVDTNMSTVSVSITAAVLNELGSHVANEPTQSTRIIIYKAVSDDLTEYTVLFDGLLTGISFNDQNVATVQVTQRASILDRDIEMIIHQAPCNHHVFDTNCKLDRILYVVSVPVVVTGATLFNDTFDTYDDGYFTGGEVIYQDDARLITNHVGGNLTLHVPFSGEVSTGTEVQVYPGCNGLPATCVSKFNNLPNFRGFAYIPNKNPAIWGV